jgi:DHA3 family macrolide efflux protein-like MFS transporter
VQQLAPNDTRSFGLVIASYGIGNFAGALYFGNHERPRSALMMFSGYIWLGLGFVLIALSPTIHWIMLSAAFTGFSGTMNEVTFFDLIQTRFPIGEITRIFRLRMATDTAAILAMMLIAPLLLRLTSVRIVIHLCGGVWILTGLFGLIWFLKSLDPDRAG